MEKFINRAINIGISLFVLYMAVIFTMALSTVTYCTATGKDHCTIKAFFSEIEVIAAKGEETDDQ